MEDVSLKYSESDSIEAGLRFKTYGGSIVETTGVTEKIESHNISVHEVVVSEGSGQGYKYLYNLDNAEKL